MRLCGCIFYAACFGLASFHAMSERLSADPPRDQIKLDQALQESPNADGSAKPSFPQENPPDRGLNANLYMQTSAEYRATCYQAFALAQNRLHAALVSMDPATRPAVILDLDETVINNGGYQTWMQRTGRSFSMPLFSRWEQYGGDQARLVPGAKAFIDEAVERGATIFYISNRSEQFFEQTLALLTDLDIAPSDRQHLMLRTDTSDKTARRNQVAKLGFTAVLNIGDNLRDFDESFAFGDFGDDDQSLDKAIAARHAMVDRNLDRLGQQWIIVPNPSYGEWTKPLGRGRGDVRRMEPGVDQLQFAFWNVENLFDTVDDPNVVGDEEFTTEGSKRWDQQRLDTKLDNLSKVIRNLNRCRGPDVLGLAEIENRSVIEMLLSRLSDLPRNYKIVHKDSPSDRGIDCAILYDADVLRLTDQQFHFVDADKTRDIVEATFERGDRAITCFVNHWPSRRNPPWQRAAAADVLRGRVNDLLADDPMSDLVLMGDYNDRPTDPSLAQHLRAVGRIENLTGDLLLNSSTFDRPSLGTGTHYGRNGWQIIDQIILSPGMLLPGGVNWAIGSTRSAIVVDDQLYDPAGDPPPRPSRSFTRNKFHKNGYSDHLPVVCEVYWAQ